MNWLLNFLKSKSKKDVKKYLIIGLGNIGSEYVNTRHNIGFKIIDYIAKEEDVAFKTEKLGSIAQLKIKGRSVFLLKPNTYMNLSGKAVRYWIDKEKINLENILVVTDDLNLSFGTFRIKSKGSDGGHNGLKSIQSILNTTLYPRFRFGISNDFKKGKQVDYVLGEWTKEEKMQLIEKLKVSSEIVRSFVLAGLNTAMNNFNRN